MKVVKSLDDIFLPEEGSVEIPREKETLRIPIRAIPMSVHQKMIRENRPPAPPKKMDKSGKLTEDGKPGLYFDENDPVHQELLAEKQDVLMREMILAGVALDIPGNTPEEKWENLSAKLTAGDFNLIMESINEISNITGVEEVKNS